MNTKEIFRNFWIWPSGQPSSTDPFGRPDFEKIKEMQYKINLLTQTVNELEKLPVDDLQKENEMLKSENADLEEQVKFINENYERHQEEKLKIENYLADLEETIEEKEKVHMYLHPFRQCGY